jgi:carboxylate-amine ligase
MEFNSSPEPTIGVEVEFQLLDRDTLDFKNAAPDVLRTMTPTFKGRIKEECIESMVEINTGICTDMKAVDKDLRGSIAHLEDVLDGLGAVYYSSSLHPLEKGMGKNITKNPRYLRIMEDLQLVGRRFITQGLHVHIGVDTPMRAVRINNTMRMYLPLLLALSTSSPYYCGEDTGLLSYRTKIFGALPLAGMPDSLSNWDEYSHVVELLQAGGIIETVRDVWWDVRPHPDFGTVETRICDIPCRYREILAIAALVQSMVATMSHLHLHPDTRVQMQILKANKWQAARYGLDGVFVNPISARRSPIREAVSDLMDLVRPEAVRLGAINYMDAIYDILDEGTGAHKQKAIYTKTGDFKSMITSICEGFYE